jgi:hypothetical protein
MNVHVQSGDKIHATKYLSLVSEILHCAQDDKGGRQGDKRDEINRSEEK